MRFSNVVLALALASPAVAAGSSARADSFYPCLPPPSPSGATCAFDTWGYVRDAAGAPVAGARVTDGSESMITGSDGYYHLIEPQQGSYGLRASVSSTCYADQTVSHFALNGGYAGGTRADFTLPCA